MQGDTEPRRATVRMIEQLWHEQGIEFEDLADGGFRLRARPELFDGRASDLLHRDDLLRSVFLQGADRAIASNTVEPS